MENKYHHCCHANIACSECFSTLLEMKEMPRAMSLGQSKNWYGEKWEVMEEIVGNMNSMIREINKIKRKVNLN